MNKITADERKWLIKNIEKIKDLNKLSSNLNENQYYDIMEILGTKKWNYSKRKEQIINFSLNYIMDLYNSLIFLSASNSRNSYMIIFRTIAEMYIKLLYLLKKDDDSLYEDFVKVSLVSEKNYLESLSDVEGVSDNFKNGTKESIKRLADESGIFDIEALSRNRINFPKIETMFTYLSESDVIGKYIYNIFYRGNSNYVHGNWSAIQMFSVREESSTIDVRLTSAIGILIPSLLLEVNKLFEFLEKLEIEHINEYILLCSVINEEEYKREGRV